MNSIANTSPAQKKAVGNAAATGTFAQEGDKAGALTIAKGATVNIDSLLMLFGGTVDVADGVKFTLDDATKDDVALNVAAGKKITIDTKGNDVDYQDLLGDVTADSTNKVSFGGDVTNQSQNLDVKIQGGAIDLSNASMDMNGNGSLYAIAAKGATDADADNKLSATDLTVKNGDTALLIGGTVADLRYASRYGAPEKRAQFTVRTAVADPSEMTAETLSGVYGADWQTMTIGSTEVQLSEVSESAFVAYWTKDGVCFSVGAENVNRWDFLRQVRDNLIDLTEHFY